MTDPEEDSPALAGLLAGVFTGGAFVSAAAGLFAFELACSGVLEEGTTGELLP